MGGLMELNCSNNRLRGPIPVELLRWKLVEGRTIELKGNAGLELPSNIGELGDSVTKIDLRSHNLRGPLPMMPTSIETLTLNNNQFTGGIPSEWGSLTNLRSLEMYSCGIGGNIPPEIGQLTNLRGL